MTSKRKQSSKRKTATPSSKKKKGGVVLARPDLDFTRPLAEQKEALEEFADSFAEEMMKRD